jgi:hypothetical protein
VPDSNFALRAHAAWVGRNIGATRVELKCFPLCLDYAAKHRLDTCPLCLTIRGIAASRRLEIDALQQLMRPHDLSVNERLGLINALGNGLQQRLAQ